ncbi:MAG: pyruvate formate lyase-activating protein [Oscillospiraceae bacterium]|nr:pyruvate formate lyase-activating protein [Oscillospiraceae bacterium]MBQ8377975.1 pyruvate formate lyase-activating protein [Oscillospiraceae bacterium]MBQ8883783.1 pyruvate formate lyase-activating protein [Oscillospiraceae bacterium]
MIGRINSIQTLGTLDGPGVRFVLFMQGCPLRCAYCHNPDTWDFNQGMEYSAEDIFQKVLRYKAYFGDTGGITVSGGEPLIQAEFVTELFTLCKENGIHTCLDTSGGMWSPKIKKLLEVTDLCLLDVKMTNAAYYEKYIGWKMEPVMTFLDKLKQMNVATWIRQVIVPDINDNYENIRKLRIIKNNNPNITKIELLPFRKLCVVKYENLGIKFPLTEYSETSKEEIDRLQAYLR